MYSFYETLIHAKQNHKKLLAILIDPEKFNPRKIHFFLKQLPSQTTHLFVGGSTATHQQTFETINCLKENCTYPIIIFPGDYSQITPNADSLLFLSLLSGENPEYLIGQHVKAVPILKNTVIEVIPTGYLLIDGGKPSSVERVSNTTAIPQNQIDTIINTAIAAYFLGKKLLYLEAGSGALNRVNDTIIKSVKQEVFLPLIVGGGIKTQKDLNQVFKAGADMAVMGTRFENQL